MKMSLNILRYVLLCFFIFVLNQNSQVNSKHIGFYCPSTTNHSPNNTFRSNLKFLLSSLSANASRPNGFYNSTSGGRTGSQEAAYGLFLCRGDVSPDVCQNCVTTGTKEMLHNCPNGTVSVIWYDECLVRYSDQSIVGNIDLSGGSIIINVQNISDSTRFSPLLRNTINNIVTKAALDRSGKKFATKEADFTQLETLYTLAQCTPDLSDSNCNNCLQTAIANLPMDKRGAAVLFPSCTVRYGLNPFYNIPAVAPPPAVPPTTPAVPSSPSPSPTNSTTNDGGKEGIAPGLIVAIVVPIVVSVLLFIVGFCWLRRRKSHNQLFVEEEMTDPFELLLPNVE